MFGKWRKEFHEDEYKKGQQAVSREVAAQDLQEAARLAAETIDLAKELEADGDPDKRELAALVRKAAVGAARQVNAGGLPEERRGALEASPFVPSLESSVGSEPSSSGSTMPLPPTRLNEPPDPPKRGRGRPRKHPKP